MDRGKKDKILRIEMRKGKEIEVISKTVTERIIVLQSILFFGTGCFWIVFSIAAGLEFLLIGAPTGIFLIYIAITGYLSFTAEYKIGKNGIKVKYLYGPENYIPWDEFQQVCVCYGEQNKRGGAAVYICCVKKGEKKIILDTGRLMTHCIIVL